MRSVRVGLAVALLASALAGVVFPAVAFAQEYDLSFTLPTYGKSGCMVCHGDRNLVTMQSGQTISYWIDEAVIRNSAHGGIMCTGCHTDFSYKAPHTEAGQDWRDTAKFACKNCHNEQYNLYSVGVHSISVTPGQERDPEAQAKPLCGDCHGSHDIQMLTDSPEGQAALHADGREVCGVCHKNEWESYDDYYHGAAYKRGAPDAPSCWTCHGAHDIYPSGDRRSRVADGHIRETCQQCHKDVTEGYLDYTELIHGRQEKLAQNPLYQWLVKVRDGVSGFFAGLFGASVTALVE
ncbi:MAG: hypothetical protein Kow0056_09800 [Coriobacteriia bacterium]